MIRYELKLRAGGIYVMESKDQGRYVLHRDVADLERQLADGRDLVRIALRRLNTADQAVVKLAECYNYGAGFYNQPGFHENLLALFAAYGFAHDELKGAVNRC